MTTNFTVDRTWTAIALPGLLAAITTLGGCAANLSGVGGETTFKCKAPDGVQCQSVSGTYANARVGNLPSQQSPGASTVLAPGLTATSLALAPSALSPSRIRDAAAFGAIRSDPTIIRIWIAPWEDADGDLMDQTYVYMPLDTGHWLIEHNRQRIKREFAPVRAPASAGTNIPVPKPIAARPTQDEDDGPPEGAAALAAGMARLRSTGRGDAAAAKPADTTLPEAPE